MRYGCSIVICLAGASLAAAQAPKPNAAKHWAFRPIVTPAAPQARNSGWPRNPIDAFIAAQHEERGIKPAPPADPRTLLRRLHFDLIGLPPSALEVEQFVAAWHRATSPENADTVFERSVERLLQSPHYGERWGRHWLDVARWAESEGYESNHPRPYAWRYRDWVVNAFNNDMPFADFVRAQIAGDEIIPYADANLIATGFLAAARLSSNEEDRYRQRNDMLIDIVNATASAFLGLTLQCAQCHDHRIDPLTARDYYRFQGFFVQGQPGNLALRDPKLCQEYYAQKPAIYDEAVRERDRLYETARSRKQAATRLGLPLEARRALELTKDRRTPSHEKLARQTELLFQFSAGQIENALNDDERPRYNHLKKQVAELEKGMLDRPQTFGFFSPVTSPHRVDVLPMKGFYPLAYDPKELTRARPYLLTAGDVHQPNGVLDAGWPAVFGATTKRQSDPTSRSALADWLTAPSHPLTARVYVNRVWKWHFGRGLVATASDFGVQGAPPTHPELLDWLASEFLRVGGSTKHLHRLIVTSNAYRQSARAAPSTLAKDPDNRFWSRWQPRRLEGEAIRDAILSVSGALDREVGGPSQPADDEGRRRSLYLMQKRDAPAPQQALFDGPTAMTESCAHRPTTTAPLQSLYLLNSKFSMRHAQALAQRVLADAGKDVDRQITLSFRLTLQRLPDAKERELGRKFLGWQGGRDSFDGPPATLVRWCQSLMNVNEFIYID